MTTLYGDIKKFYKGNKAALWGGLAIFAVIYLLFLPLTLFLSFFSAKP